MQESFSILLQPVKWRKDTQRELNENFKDKLFAKENEF